MGIQIYWNKRNFDTQKAERFFKERKVAVQLVDLKKHRLGRREVELFARGVGPKALLDLDNPRVREHPAAYTNTPDNVIGYIVEDPWLLVSPILRNGNQVIIGFDQQKVSAWLASGS